MRIIFIYFIRKKKTTRVIAATDGAAIAAAGIEIANAILTNPAIAAQTERAGAAATAAGAAATAAAVGAAATAVAAGAAVDVGAAKRYYFLYYMYIIYVQDECKIFYTLVWHTFAH